MKRLLLFLATAFVILACSKEDEPAPAPAPKPKFSITIVASEGGSVSSTGGTYEQGSTFSVTATAASGYRFVGWSNGETAATINITVVNNLSLTATFEKLTYSIDVSGAIAKGAFLTGSTLTFYELNNSLSQTGKTYNTDITDQFGSYSLHVEEVTEDYARVVGEGFYWNEVTNETTSEKITLNALSEIKEGVNVNILTHLEYPRVEQLVKTEGKSFSDAKRQALTEVLSSLGIETTTDYGTAEQFNFANGDDRSKILAVVSIIIQAERSPAEVTAFITKVANELKDNGNIDDDSIKTEIAIPLAKINLQEAATHLYTYYKELNPELTAEDFLSDYLETAKAEFQQYLPDADGDGIQDDLDQCPDTPSDEEADSNGCGKSQKAYQLTTTVEGSGSVSEEIIVQPSASYDYGTTVRLTANPIVGWEFKEWTGDISSTENPYDILIEQEVSVTAVFVKKQFNLDLTIEGEGTVTKNPDQSSYEYQSSVELTATPSAGWVFKEWKGDIPSTTNPITVEFNSDKEMVAVFERKMYDLNVSVNGEGAVAEEVITTPGRYEDGTAIELTATPANGWEFTGWTGDIEATQNPINITLTSEKNITANFAKKKFTLTTSKEGEGSVSVDPEAETYEFNTSITLTATPAEGWSFSKWTGDIESEDNPLNIKIDDNITVKAVFKRKQYDLEIAIEGEGTVTQEIVEQPTKYDYQTKVKLTAIAEEGWVFSRWSGDAEADENPLTIEINKAKNLTAVFVKKQYDLTITVEGEGTVLEELIVQPTQYEHGSSVKLTAIAEEGWVFNSWGGDLQGSENPIVVDIEGAKSVTAVFQRAPGGIYLDENGVTIKANINAVVGERYILENTGEEYLVVDEEMLRGMLENGEDVSKVVTTRVTNMDVLFNTETSYKGEYTGEIATWDTSNVISMEDIFSGHYIENEDDTVTYIYNHANPDITYWNTGNVNSFFSAFFLNDSFNQDIGSWDISSAINLRSMFNRATVFNQDISGWDTSRVDNMRMLFRGPSAFNQDISDWNTSNVTNMYGMFWDNGVFDQPIGEWDVSKVADTSWMFENAAFNQPIGEWDFSNAITMQGMFYNNSSFNQNINSWNTASVEDMSWMFASSTYNKTIGDWNTSNVRVMNSMFENNSEFNQDISNWNVSNVTNMWAMFYGTPFNQPIGNWNVSSVTNMQALFSNSTAFNQDISNWNVSNVENMSWMFFNNTSYNQHLGNWNVSSVTNMQAMFAGASAFNQDLSNWDVSSVTIMQGMFDRASSFNQDISSWNVSRVEYMNGMFANTSYNQPLNPWNVGSVINFDGMFWQNSEFNQPIGVWNVSSANIMNNMFGGANSFNQDISNWNVSNVTDFGGMFSGNETAFDQDLSSWDVSSATRMAWMFSGASNFNQDISNWNVSNVTDFKYMFQDARVFNQDLSDWCVANASEYDGFDRNTVSWTLPKPYWGSCGAPSFEITLNFYDIPNDQNFEHIFFSAAPGWHQFPEIEEKMMKKVVLYNENDEAVRETIYKPEDNLQITLPAPSNDQPHYLKEYLFYADSEHYQGNTLLDNFYNDGEYYNFRYQYELEFTSPIFTNSTPTYQILNENTDALLLVDKDIPVLKVGIGTTGFAPGGRHIYVDSQYEEYPIRLYFDTYYIDKIIPTQSETTTLITISEDDIQYPYTNGGTDLWKNDLIYSSLKDIYDSGSNIPLSNFLNAFKEEADRLGVSLGADPTLSTSSSIIRDNVNYLAITDNICSDDNPNITISNAFYDMSFGQQMAVIFHEFGHAYFSYDHENFGIMMSNVSISQYRNYTGFKNELNRFFDTTQHQLIDCGGNSRQNPYLFEGQKINKIFFKL